MNCERLKYYGKTKSEAIMKMLEEKYKNIEKAKKKVPNAKLFKLFNEYLILEAKYRESYKTIKALAKKEGFIIENDYERTRASTLKYDWYNACFVPPKRLQQIQKAINLSSLGQTKEASALLNSIIEEEKLL